MPRFKSNDVADPNQNDIETDIFGDGDQDQAIVDEPARGYSGVESEIDAHTRMFDRTGDREELDVVFSNGEASQSIFDVVSENGEETPHGDPDVDAFDDIL